MRDRKAFLAKKSLFLWQNELSKRSKSRQRFSSLKNIRQCPHLIISSYININRGIEGIDSRDANPAIRGKFKSPGVVCTTVASTMGNRL